MFKKNKIQEIDPSWVTCYNEKRSCITCKNNITLNDKKCTFVMRNEKIKNEIILHGEEYIDDVDLLEYKYNLMIQRGYVDNPPDLNEVRKIMIMYFHENNEWLLRCEKDEKQSEINKKRKKYKKIKKKIINNTTKGIAIISFIFFTLSIIALIYQAISNCGKY